MTIRADTVTEIRRTAKGATELLMAAARGEVKLSEQKLQLCHTVINKAVTADSERESEKTAA